MIFIDKYSNKFVEKTYDFYKNKIINSDRLINSKECLGNDMLGWMDLDADLNLINSVAKSIRDSSDCILVIGIGGSYLGAKMSIDFLNPADKEKVHFIGNNLDAENLINTLKSCEEKSVHVVVISKSGNTIEIKSTLDIVVSFMRKKYSNIKQRFTVITGKSGYLKKYAEQNDWRILNIPENVGGRFSVLTNVGLLPMCISGIKIENVILGALDMKRKSQNIFSDCHKYALVRNALYSLGFKIELFSSFSMRLLSAMEWIKQLFGESEGKDSKGIFPASSLFSTDLHSLGQFIQEGSKILFETIIFCQNQDKDLIISDDVSDTRLKNKSFNELNKRIFESTVKAHYSGGVPCNILNFDKFTEENLGRFIYFFEKSCAISAICLGVNPFNQPGVEIYKKNIF